MGILWTVLDESTYAPAGYDANGNIIAWVNTADGILSGIREYGAFGENIASTGVGALDQWAGIPFGFSTKYQDRLTGHYYYGYRFYDTSTGRWLSKDPIGGQGGLTLYAFAGNNGVNRWDYLGLMFGNDPFEGIPSLADFERAEKGMSDEGFCSVVSFVVQRFLDRYEAHRAWNRYVSGIGGEIKLSEDEWKDIISVNDDFKELIEKRTSECNPSKTWKKKTESVGGRSPDPWRLAIGDYQAKVTSSCDKCCLTWKAELSDPYDFDIKIINDLAKGFKKGFKGWEPQRGYGGEAKTAAVAIASVACYKWKPFKHTGSTNGKSKNCDD